MDQDLSSNRLFQQLFEASPDANLIVDQGGKIMLANAQAEKLFGYPREELVGQAVEMLVPAEFHAVHEHHRAQYHQQARMRPMGAGLNLLARRKNGSTFPTDIMLSPFEAPPGQVVLCVVKDISLQKANQQALQEQTGIIRLVQEITATANQARSIENVIQFSIERIGRYLGWPIAHAFFIRPVQQEGVKHLWNDTLPERYAEFIHASESLNLEPGRGLPGMVISVHQPLWVTGPADRPNVLRSEVMRKTGIKTALVIPVLENDRIAAVLEFFSETLVEPKLDLLAALPDISTQIGRVIERKQLELELDEMQHRLIESIEIERIRMAQRLHDGPIQDLYGIFYLLQEVKGVLEGQRQQVVDNILQAIKEVNATLSSITGELRPSTLVHLGLSQAIRSNIDLLQERVPGMLFHLDLADDVTSLDPSLRLPLFRVYMKLISNVVRHSQARHAWVRLQFDAQNVVLEVQDNGTGFEPNKNSIDWMRQGRYGIAGVIERVEAMNGTVTFESAPQKGTFVRVTIPLESKQPG